MKEIDFPGLPDEVLHRKFNHRYWVDELKQGIGKLLHTREVLSYLDPEHIRCTPDRFVESIFEYFWGLDKDPKEMMTLFPGDSKVKDQPQMIHVGGYQFYSMCAHHMAPFFGKMHFAYIPEATIVGLSKIPRLIEIYARRPQVQENLTDQIVDSFQEIVNPRGCAVLVRASHFCMEARGIKAHGTETTTTALRGIFLEDKVKQEFLMAANRLEWK